jgi:quinol monooxygenase YgiN
MTTLVVRAVCAIKTGKYDELLAAAGSLHTTTQAEPGVILFEHYVDEKHHKFIGIEVYQDEAALVHHLSTGDLGPVTTLLDLEVLQVHGPCSQQVCDMLTAVADVDLYHDMHAEH